MQVLTVSRSRSHIRAVHFIFTHIPAPVLQEYVDAATGENSLAVYYPDDQQELSFCRWLDQWVRETDLAHGIKVVVLCHKTRVVDHLHGILDALRSIFMPDNIEIRVTEGLPRERMALAEQLLVQACIRGHVRVGARGIALRELERNVQ